MSFTLFISSFTFCTLFVVYFLSFIFIPYFPNLSLILSFFTIYPLSLITFFIPYPLIFSAFIPYPLYFLAFIPYPLRLPDPSPKKQSIQLPLIFPMYLHYMSVSIDFQIPQHFSENFKIWQNFAFKLPPNTPIKKY